LAEYLLVEMLPEALSGIVKAKVVMQLESHPRDPSMFKYNKLPKHILCKCVTPNSLPLLDPEGAHPALGVSSYSVSVAVPLPQRPVVVNFPAMSNKQLLGSVQATDDRKDRYLDIDHKGGVCQCWSMPGLSVGKGSREGE
jgi:hypothetical protein